VLTRPRVLLLALPPGGAVPPPPRLGGRRVAPPQSGEPHAAPVFKGTFTREWGHGECRGFAAVVPSDTLCLMRQRGQDTALLIGVTLRKAP